MNDIHFNVEAVKEYGIHMLAVSKEIETVLDNIERSIHEVRSSWNDDSIQQVENQFKQIKKGILHSQEILQSQVKRKIQRQLEWASKYSHIKM